MREIVFRVLTGGQTGADQGALRAAETCGIPTGGFIPKGYMTEEGPAPHLAHYGLVETDSEDYRDRTVRNVGLSDALIWFGDTQSPGGRLTLDRAIRKGIPILVVGEKTTSQEAYRWLVEEAMPRGGSFWLMAAGNRESKSPGIGVRTEAFLTELFRKFRSEVTLL